MNKIITVLPYDEQWPEIFKKESDSIRKALGDNYLNIHHIGSTAIPGLLSKPKIDMIVVVQDPIRAREQLKGLGIEYRGEYNIPLHYGFSKRGAVNLNVHVYEPDHPEIELNLLFRDYMRNNPQDRDAYALLKIELLKDASCHTSANFGLNNYCLKKGVFIRGILKKAGFNRVRILKASDQYEWQEVQRFRSHYFFDPLGIKDPYTWTFDHEEHVHLILYQGADIIGYAHIQLWPQARAAIRIMVINEDKRNKNFGTIFLQLCHQWLKAQGIKTVHVESRPTSVRFYEKNGYVPMPFNDPMETEIDPQDVPLGKVL